MKNKKQKLPLSADPIGGLFDLDENQKAQTISSDAVISDFSPVTDKRSARVRTQTQLSESFFDAQESPSSNEAEEYVVHRSLFADDAPDTQSVRQARAKQKKQHKTGRQSKTKSGIRRITLQNSRRIGVEASDDQRCGCRAERNSPELPSPHALCAFCALPVFQRANISPIGHVSRLSVSPARNFSPACGKKRQTPADGLARQNSAVQKF